ncbi:MAG: hypothetical protein CK424_04130 [Legionella sp.]|nr:MAG: hypothetical protein CK424_04130 [Legionella sp.]
MLTPNGHPANKIEKVMLLSMWANTLQEEIAQQSTMNTKRLLTAGLGKPTYPINSHTISSYLNYWQKMSDLTKRWYLNPEEHESSAIDYGDPRGDLEPRVLMSDVMSKWYESDIKPDHILFTVGGIGALRVIFETFNTHYDDTPGYRVITPFPHYSAYSNNPMHRLHPIEVMDVPGYKLTAKAVEKSIKEAYELAASDHGLPKAILICNPSNPLGTVIDAVEMKAIAKVLRRYPDLYIILDEAYAEMCYVELPSFLKIAPDLKKRMIIMRSATKALSAAGERMAILMVFETALMNEFLNKNISYFIHAPRSAQMAYAQTMINFDDVEKQNLREFYKQKVDYVLNRLNDMSANMPDISYTVHATFYALGNFSDLFGLMLPIEAQRALQKKGKITTDEELAYYLLFKDSVMIAPLSYFGLPNNKGFIRITCSGNIQELKELMDRLEYRLFKARKKIKLAFLESIMKQLPELKNLDESMYLAIIKKMALFSEEDTCKSLKTKNEILQKIKATIEGILDLSNV